jgi:hypothetical protein
MAALRKELAQIPNYQEFFLIHTIGYGYALGSKLLYDISVLGNEINYHIPEYNMIGTNFVNFLSNTLSSLVFNAKLTIS